MNILMVGPSQTSPTDGIIVKGIKYLLQRAYGDHDLTYITLRDTIHQTAQDYVPDDKFDLVVVAGTPWLWDSFQNSVKFKNLILVFNTHPEAKKLVMGIGSNLYLKDVATNLLERPEEQQAMRQAYGDATVIVRDKLAQDRLSKAGIKSTLLPCPAYYCYGHEPIIAEKTEDVIVFQDPKISLSCDIWQDKAVLDKYFQQVQEFKTFHNVMKVYCAIPEDQQTAIKLGFTTAKVLENVDETLEVMRRARYVLSGRVHCAVPAISRGAYVTLMPLDSRSYVIEDFKHVKDFMVYVDEYITVMQKALTRKVGTESQRTYEQFRESGFFTKYMSGVGLDIGYAGYTSGVLPILPGAIGIDMDYPGYDGKTLPFADGSQDYVYSSHCLEHIADYNNALKEWFRVTKIGGHVVIAVPHKFLYEKKADLPSRWNLDHKRFYTPASLMTEVELSLAPNTYRVRLLEDGDQDFNYRIPPDKHSSGRYEILLVLQKIKPPIWNLK